MATALKNEVVKESEEWTKPSFLRRVRIQGYKSIAFCDVALQPLTILVGRNAAGKSNFLDALAFLRDAIKLNLPEALKRHGGPQSMLCRSAVTDEFTIAIEASFRTHSGSDCLADYRLTIPVTGGPTAGSHQETLRLRNNSSEQIEGFDLADGKLRWFGSDGKLHVPSDHLVLGMVGHPITFSFAEKVASMGFYNFQPDAIRGLHKPVMGAALLERDGSNLSSVIRTLAEIDPDSLLRVREYLADVAEEVKQFEAIQYGEYETVRFRLRDGTPDKPLELDAACMSDGTLRVLSSIMAAFQIVPPFGHPGLVGIEEPETALHPAALRALVDALREATQHTQILLTTHSADMLADRYLDLAGVLVVRSRDGRTQIAPVDAASREIVQKELYTLADLQRMDHLEPDATDLIRQTQMMIDMREK